MTPTIKELTAARDWFKDRFGDFKQEVENGTRGALGADKTWGHIQTIISLLDSHINPPDLSELKREVNKVLDEKFTKTNDEYENNIVNAAIDHLAPRIAREGMVVVPVEPTEYMVQQGVYSENTLECVGEDYPSYEQSCTNIYKSMISAAQKKED